MKRRERDISSINSSGRKKARNNDTADAIYKLANNQDRMNLDKARLEVMQRKEERLNERHEIEKEKLSTDSAIQKQKMKIDYLESLFKNNSIDDDDLEKYKDLLKEAREKYFDLLS
jgi:Zn-dependent metalloprotease